MGRPIFKNPKFQNRFPDFRWGWGRFAFSSVPVRPRVVTLPIAVAWTFFAGWAAWVDFHPESWAHWGLVATSLYLLFAGAVQQVIPERNKA